MSDFYDYEEDEEYSEDEAFAEACRDVVTYQDPDFVITVITQFDEGPYLAVVHKLFGPIEATFVPAEGNHIYRHREG